jgi:hypothetical protein
MHLAMLLTSISLFGAAQAQALIRFLPNSNSSDTQVETVSALANDEFYLLSSLGRLRLASDLRVRAINKDDNDYPVKTLAVGAERIEIGQLSGLYGFSGIAAEFSTQTPRGCSVRRFDAGESLRWYQWIKDASCTDVAVSENGEIWLTSGVDIILLRGDGTLKRLSSLSVIRNSKITSATPARGVNVGGAFIRYEPFSQAPSGAVAFVDAAGVERWRVPTNVSSPGVRALADGGVEITASTVQIFNSAGIRTAQRANPAIAGTLVADAVDAESGERWVLSKGAECALTKLSAAGVSAWRTVVPCAVTMDRVDNPRNGESGRPAVLLSQTTLAIVGKNAIALLNQTGALLLVQSVGEDDFREGVSTAALNTLGTRLLYVANSFRPELGFVAKLRQIVLATKLDLAVDLPARPERNSPLIAQESAPDGSIFAFTYGSNDTQTLTAIAKNGQVRWQIPLAFEGFYDNFVGASNRMVCIMRALRAHEASGESKLLCWNSLSGQLLFDLRKPYGYFPNDKLAGDLLAAPSMRVFDDRVLIARASVSESDTLSGNLPLENYEAISSTGTQLFAFNLPGGMTEHLWSARGLVATNAPRQNYSVQTALNYFAIHGSYVGFNASDTLFSTWDQDGRQLSVNLYPYAQSELYGAAPLSRGTLVGRREGSRVASSDPRSFGLSLVPGTLFYEFFDLAGVLKWRQPASAFDTGFLIPDFVEPGRAPEPYPIIPVNSRLEVKEDRREAQPMLYVLRSYDAGDQAFAPSRAVLQKINLDTGALLWRRSVNVDADVSFGRDPIKALELPAEKINGQWQVLVYGNNVSGARLLESFDVNGNALDVQPLADEFPESAAITAGDVRFVLRQPPPSARTAQALGLPSQVGAWYNPATPGQGFFIERIGNTQFLAWFHNDWDLPDAAVTDFLAPARQRWLSMQGEVAPGATQATLKIYQSSGGSFIHGSAGAPVEIGSATLRFLSCDSATLSYELRAQRCATASCVANQQQFAMLHGVIPLRALLPASSCATPTSLPAPISAKTGLFHDPNVSGQGLMSVVNADTLFAGWFTRDPSNAADDPQKQAWFTLQASLPANASADNVIRAKIYRTLGGRRDASLPVSTQEVGAATLSFSGCDRLSMRYQFAPSDAVKPFQNLSGQLDLVRIGACR